MQSSWRHKQRNWRARKRRLLNDIQNERDLVTNVVYGLKLPGKEWVRAMVKFHREDGVAVLQVLDNSGLVDFDPRKMSARILTKPALVHLPYGEMKMVIYAIKKIEADHDFKLIFDQTIFGQEVTAIYTLLEQKANKMLECFVGDCIYAGYNGQLKSFRELLIQ